MGGSTRTCGGHTVEPDRPNPAQARERDDLLTIVADQRKYSGHYADRPRHTQQVDYFIYIRDMNRRELPAGRRRARELGPVPLAGRAGVGATA